MRTELPTNGSAWNDLEQRMREMSAGDRAWRAGRVPLYVFRATEDAAAVGQQAFDMFFTENALGGRRAFHGIAEMEQQVLDIALGLFQAPDGGAGAFTSGGSESILVAVKAARDHARAAGRSAPFNIAMPYSGHPAFDKAASLMDLEIRRVPLSSDLRADPDAMAAAMDDGTILLVGSVPCFPHGVVDPIPALSTLAGERGVWLHVDACVGGYLAPFVKANGDGLPDFDFALPGVASISADLHKFGFCPKPASTVLFRRREDMERAAMGTDQWPHGLFATPTVTGTRPAGAVAAAWAVLHHLGWEGYREVARRLIGLTQAYVEGIEAIDGLRMLARPDLSIVNFTSDRVAIPALAEAMDRRGWLPGMTRTPPGLHIMLSMLHEPAREDYIADLRAAVAEAAGAASEGVETASYA